ncbi:MAG: T9SS type A sorting domain-containing protein [Bacteroidota bacterium]|nr:MAG: T9SS type A sorting domain-containing protein [Bacteroidota bacterium]
MHHALTVAPNPCSADLNVTLNFNLTGSSKYTVLDMFGRTVKQFMSTEINNQFPVQDLASGQYILMLSNGNNRSSIVFNKQ